MSIHSTAHTVRRIIAAICLGSAITAAAATSASALTVASGTAVTASTASSNPGDNPWG